MPADRIELMIREIAARHGVALTRDDPVLMLLTIFEHVMRDGQAQQAELLVKFKAELEVVMQRVKEDSREKAGLALQEAVTASQASLQQATQAGVEEAVQSVQIEIQNGARTIKGLLANSERVALFNMGAAGLTTLSALIALWARL